MLSFILSKMNMMIFATGVFIVAVLFLSFMSTSNDTREAVSLLISKAKIIEEQLSTESLCSLKVQSIPDTLRKGIGSDFMFYEMQFTSQRIGGVTDSKTVLELSIQLFRHISYTSGKGQKRTIRLHLRRFRPFFLLGLHSD